MTNQNKQCTLVQNISFILKQPCNFCPYLHCTKRVCPVQVTFIFSVCIFIKVYSSVNSLLPITRTSFNFSPRLELSKVDCSKIEQLYAMLNLLFLCNCYVFLPSFALLRSFMQLVFQGKPRKVLLLCHDKL